MKTMAERTRHLPRTAWLATAAVTLGACAALQPQADPTRYYVLTVEPGGAAPPSAPRAAGSVTTPRAAGSVTTLGVGRVVIPAYLDRSELVSRTGSNQLSVHDEARWGEPLREGLERTLRGDLASQLSPERVRHAPSEGARPTDLVVDIEVRRFEPVASPGATPTVEFEAAWTVREAGSGRVVAAHTSTLRQPITSGSGEGAAVAAMSRAVAQVSRDIAGAVTAAATRPSDGAEKLPVRGGGH